MKKQQSTPQKTTRGTDEIFLKLMTLSGSSILKLLGVPPKQADQYEFRAVTLKEKEIRPDVEGISMWTDKAGPVFLEFQGYSDPFIRYRLMASIFLGCAQKKYDSSVIAGIIYTDAKYKKAALSLSTVAKAADCEINPCFFKEIVLSEYTEKQLLNADPKLIVLAPFTLDSKTNQTQLVNKTQQWKTEITQNFPIKEQQDALDILGLFVLNRFRHIQYEEVIAMLNFDLMDTVAGKQVYDMGLQKGVINEAQEMVLKAIDARFGMVPNEVVETIHGILQQDVLENLHRQAILSPDRGSFKEILSKTTEKK
ncbi:MAG TPA: hypothetical protein DCM38_09075 [Gammaproteobacteria bacterium]|nr:hypothetical protein [Gammaproteobacteria bacterium]